MSIFYGFVRYIGQDPFHHGAFGSLYGLVRYIDWKRLFDYGVSGSLFGFVRYINWEDLFYHGASGSLHRFGWCIGRREKVSLQLIIKQ